MATLTTTVRRKNIDRRWCLLHPSRALDFFTQEEIESVLLPFLEYAARRPGLIPNSHSSVIGSYSAIFEMKFDTVEHAEEARTLLSQGSTVPVVKAKHDLLESRRKLHNIDDYTVTTHVSP